MADIRRRTLGRAAAPLEDVLARFAARGGQLVDSSPMYGRSEAVVGEIAGKLGLTRSLFLATKIWTTGRQAGIAQIAESRRRLRKTPLDLIQVHNLLDVDTHLETLAKAKAGGEVRYVGISHYRASAYGDIVRLLPRHGLDFVQINLSLWEREAVTQILPLAAERHIAVIANRPFGRGEAFRRVARRPLPGWAAEFDCRSWAQFFLKWILAHAAVTCVIPATGKSEHLDDDMEAALGALPDARHRQRMEALVSGLKATRPERRLPGTRLLVFPVERPLDNSLKRPYVNVYIQTSRTRRTRPRLSQKK